MGLYIIGNGTISGIYIYTLFILIAVFITSIITTTTIIIIVTIIIITIFTLIIRCLFPPKKLLDILFIPIQNLEIMNHDIPYTVYIYKFIYGTMLNIYNCYYILYILRYM